ncbi:MAG: hypothetical protein A3I89_03970 [Candidatus Harrisonbacteria bacterium RIFCSPLOWO2_02_FULL_41_11]|uniref:histidine kinase n=1 Tax=Candidatus Harrisonbacteria bacterium RIFCSPHIGHO2_02_FULL_42_16 TaxID=1798404 RepID=A0A1G1ZHS0_9BACT|nr:MAG: hypothetical protein A3B92_01025 [Candidatus Harrisonbacteria bacterium RIFCSPHIGHO2_02_FULL_42_16]OGY67138.1 MAG: hypothetical protein A3I89_03970 [Candidatus Harrisonbacteria bacterium RIFCSPLOWO2_02_FULL_41_11]
MRKFFKNFRQYLKSPEVKMMWLFLFLVLLIVAIDIFFLEPLWAGVSATILVSAGIVILFVNFRSAKTTVQLRLEKSRLDNVIAGIDDGIIIYDENFQVLLFNPAAEKIFNVKKEALTSGKLSPESVQNPNLSVLAKVIFQSLAPLVVLQSPEGVYPQVADISFEEPRLQLRVLTDRILDENGQVTAFIKIVRDQTREVELLQSKSDFITVAAHQLRTPLSAVNWSLESLQKENLNGGQKELAETGLSAARNLSKIVEDLLNVSKIEGGKFGYNFQQLDIVKFLQSAVEQASVVAKDYKASVYLEPPKEPSIILEADLERLGLLMSNLLENAIKYNVENGKVTVSVERRTDAPFIQVNVADTGVGIPQEAMNKIFTKFFRAENVAEKETEGSGLGLYIAKNVVNRHGGQIWAESVEGRGAIFHFTLPTDPRLIPQREIANS